MGNGKPEVTKTTLKSITRITPRELTLNKKKRTTKLLKQRVVKIILLESTPI